MKTLQFNTGVPQDVAGTTLEALNRALCWSGLTCIWYGHVTETAPPGPIRAQTQTGCDTRFGNNLNDPPPSSSPHPLLYAFRRLFLDNEKWGAILWGNDRE